MTVGVLALQGDFKEHMQSLARLHVQSAEVRTIEDLQKVDALILPGGESTTIAKLLLSTGLDSAISQRIQEGMPVWGTCAGAILLAKKIHSLVPLDTSIGVFDGEIERNSYGRQTESFITDLNSEIGSIDAAFIRAPKILSFAQESEVLASYQNDPVLVQQNKVLISTFHSEVFASDPVLSYFLKHLVAL